MIVTLLGFWNQLNFLFVASNSVMLLSWTYWGLFNTSSKQRQSCQQCQTHVRAVRLWIGSACGQMDLKRRDKGSQWQGLNTTEEERQGMPMTRPEYDTSKLFRGTKTEPTSINFLTLTAWRLADNRVCVCFEVIWFSPMVSKCTLRISFIMFLFYCITFWYPNRWVSTVGLPHRRSE